MSFLEYTGKYSKRGEKFIFKMKGGKKKISKFTTVISNPTYDNTFKIMLGSKKTILKSLLNSVLFPKSKLIEKIEYSKTYFPGKGEINHRYGFGSKSIDIGCKCILKKDNDLNIKNNVLMIDVEMQIGFTDEVEKRFIDYANAIRVDSDYTDTWVVSFIVKESMKSNNTIELNKKNSEGVFSEKKYQAIKIIEINLNYCCSLIEEDKDIEIMEELGQEGKEWIKLLSCPIWCQNNNLREDIYTIPKYTRKGFISCNYVKKAIEEIIFRPQPFDLSSVDEHYNKEERKKMYLMKKEIKELKEKLKKLQEKKDENEEDYSDSDDENDEEDDLRKSEGEEDEYEDEEIKNNNSKDGDDQDDMDIED